MANHIQNLATSVSEMNVSVTSMRNNFQDLSDLNRKRNVKALLMEVSHTNFELGAISEKIENILFDQEKTLKERRRLVGERNVRFNDAPNTYTLELEQLKKKYGKLLTEYNKVNIHLSSLQNSLEQISIKEQREIDRLRQELKTKQEENEFLRLKLQKQETEFASLKAAFDFCWKMPEGEMQTSEQIYRARADINAEGNITSYSED